MLHLAGNIHELVICDSELSRNAHKELFRFDNGAYLISDNKAGVVNTLSDVFNLCNSSTENHPFKIHTAILWENLLRIALWKSSKPTAGDVFTLLKNAGLASQELEPFRTSDTNDIFPYFYYGKQFDILKKMCHAARRQVENNLKNRTIRVDCHLVAEDTEKIVASSL